jgi:hypothetical protein
MKRLFILSIILSSTVIVYAQKASFFVTAGTTVATFKSESSSQGSFNGKGKLGFTGGISANIRIAKDFNFQPALFYTQKGGKINETEIFSGETATATGKVTLNYLEMPLNFLYTSNAGKGKFFIGAGPSLGLGIGGKGNLTATFNGETNALAFDVKFDGKNSDNVTDENLHLKAFEVSGNVLAGYQFAVGVTLTAGYNFGLSNISPDSGQTWKNNYFGIRLGYRLSGRK